MVWEIGEGKEADTENDHEGYLAIIVFHIWEGSFRFHEALGMLAV